jgi:dUTP pyrophosphatase
MSKLDIEVIVIDQRLRDLPGVNGSINGVPAFKSDGAGAMDLYACIDKPIILQPQQQVKLDLGFKLWIKDPRYAGVVMPRSSTGSLGLVMGNTVGFIDSDYQGELKCVAWNRLMPTIKYKDEVLFQGGEPITINPGDRIAQIAFMRVEQARILDVEQFGDTTVRGEGGFGSTGGVVQFSK